VTDLVALFQDSWADYKFIVGRHKPLRYFADVCENYTGEQDLLAFDVDDSFKNIAPKIQRLMEWADLQGYARVVVVDDDTYIRPERLREFLATVTNYDYVGFERTGNQHYMQGSCYIVSKFAMIALAGSPDLVEGVADDVRVGEILSPCIWKHSDRFWPGAEPRRIHMSNDLISTHKCAIAHNRHNTSMDEIHETWKESCRRHSMSAPIL
jgi:hypothetical protein